MRPSTNEPDSRSGRGTWGLIRQLFERRVPQVLGIYAAASWGLVEFAGFAVTEFLLSPHWTRVALAVVLLIFPSVLMAAWFHGKPGRDEVPRAEKIGIPVNLALAAVVLFCLYGNADLGLVTTAVSAETEEGETVERAVAKPEFRKRTALFPFDAGPGIGEDQMWIAYLAPLALDVDLRADDFFEAVGSVEFPERLNELGFPSLRDVPLALKHQIARERHSDFVVAGTVDRAGDQYRVTLSLHETGGRPRVHESVHEGPDLLALVDEMSERLRAALDIPDRDGIEDLAIRERLTGSEAALAAFGRAYRTLLADPPDLDAVIEWLRAATGHDPTFALAQYRLAQTYLDANRPEEAVASMQAAIDHLYRLPERVRLMVKADYYVLTEQPERGWAAIELWVALHPEDPVALDYYTLMQTIQGDWEGLVRTIETRYRLRVP